MTKTVVYTLDHDNNQVIISSDLYYIINYVVRHETRALHRDTLTIYEHIVNSYNDVVYKKIIYSNKDIIEIVEYITRIINNNIRSSIKYNYSSMVDRIMKGSIFDITEKKFTYRYIIILMDIHKQYNIPEIYKKYIFDDYSIACNTLIELSKIIQFLVNALNVTNSITYHIRILDTSL